MKKKLSVLVRATVFLGLVEAGLGATTVVKDDFNDGMRNKTLWRVPAGNSGLLLEQYGKLAYATISGDDAYATWEWKKAYVLIDRDRLDIVFTVSMPMQLNGAGKVMKFGVGFKDELAPGRQVHYWVEQQNLSRWFVFEATDGSSSGGGGYGPKRYPKTLMYRLRYNNRYKKASMAYKKPGERIWHAVGGGLDLNLWWGVAPHRTLRPFIFASSTGAFVPPDWFRLDDFTVTCTTINTP